MTNKKKYIIISVTAILMIVFIVCLICAKQRFDAYQRLSPDEKTDYQDMKQFKNQNNLPKKTAEAQWLIIKILREYVRNDLIEICTYGTGSKAETPLSIDFNVPFSSYLVERGHLFKTYGIKHDCFVITGKFWSKRESRWIPFTYYFGIADIDAFAYQHKITYVEMAPEKNSRHMYKLLYDIDVDAFLGH